MKKVLTVAAVAEVATGMALLIVPSLVGRLLFGAEFTGVANPAARVTGIALLALGVGCWPGEHHALPDYLGVIGEWVGPLLWPAVVLHGVLTLLLARAWRKARTQTS